MTTLEEQADEFSEADTMGGPSPRFDAAIVEYLRSVAAGCGIADVRVNIILDTPGFEFAASAPNLASTNEGRVYGFGPTVIAALADMRAKIKTPHESAAALRLEAARLAELAAKIEDAEI